MAWRESLGLDPEQKLLKVLKCQPDFLWLHVHNFTIRIGLTRGWAWKPFYCSFQGHYTFAWGRYSFSWSRLVKISPELWEELQRRPRSTLGRND